MTEITLKIEGMSCQHCVMSVRKAVGGVAGVLSSDVTVGSAKVAFDETRTNRDDIAKAIQKAGYKIKAEG
ncbi:MAG: heavy-metal-associated domain-containing protein [Nitrospirae bacterium]|nr:heavy-metal-associated domain-containing protein [Nitrospirota bacterium]